MNTMFAEPVTASDLEPAPSRWRRSRPLVLIGLVVVAAAVLLAALAARPRAGTLDPGAATAEGSRALAELLRDQGVSILAVESFADAQAQLDDGPATLLVTVPDRLSPAHLADLASDATAVVLVGPGSGSIEQVLPGVTSAGSVGVEEREPTCDLPAASAAGSADAGGITYKITSSAAGAIQCYAAGGNPTLVQISSPRGHVTVVGTGAPFTNDRLDEHGNAALTMRLLGEHPRLVWYRPAVSDVPRGDRGDESLVDLLPDGWRWAAAQLLLAVALLAIWRARRLGRIVTEPLPVVVRAAEAVEGRGRLYQRVQARDRAADALRDATRARLRGPLGVSRDVSQQALVGAVTQRTGRTETEVAALLYGAPPQDDRSLVRLAIELDAVESEVRRS